MSMAIAVVLNASATTPANTNFLIFFLLILLKTDGQFRAGGDEQHGGKEAANNPSTHNMILLQAALAGCGFYPVLKHLQTAPLPRIDDDPFIREHEKRVWQFRGLNKERRSCHEYTSCQAHLDRITGSVYPKAAWGAIKLLAWFNL